MQWRRSFVGVKKLYLVWRILFDAAMNISMNTNDPNIKLYEKNAHQLNRKNMN